MSPQYHCADCQYYNKQYYARCYWGRRTYSTRLVCVAFVPREDAVRHEDQESEAPSLYVVEEEHERDQTFQE